MYILTCLIQLVSVFGKTLKLLLFFYFIPADYHYNSRYNDEILV